MQISLVLISSLITLTASKATLPDPLFVTYWGQSHEDSLLSYCKLGYFNVINLAFVYKFGNQPLAFQTQGCSTENNYAGCSALGADIAACQSMGVKILASMGGATKYDCGDGGCQGDYTFTNPTMAAQTGTQIWQTFFNGGATTNGVPRPFPGISLDGIDLDIEMTVKANGQATQLYYDSFVNKLLSYDSNLIIGGAPECMEGDLGTNTMADIVSKVPLDFMFVQFFNNPYCAISGQGFPGYFSYWAQAAKSNPNGGSKLLIGVPGDTSAGASLSSSYWIPANQILSLVSSMRNQYPSAHIGVGVYDAGTAVGSNSPGADPQWANKIHAGLTGGTATIPSAPAAVVSSAVAPANVATASGSSNTAGSSAPTSTAVVTSGMASIVANASMTVLPTSSIISGNTTSSSISSTITAFSPNATSGNSTAAKAVSTTSGTNIREGGWMIGIVLVMVGSWLIV